MADEFMENIFAGNNFFPFGLGHGGLEMHPNGEHSHHDNNGNETATVWIFGYGSLCWHPGFEYSKCVTGYVRGYVRRFWQGNVTHRGTTEKPGRVATLVDEKEGITWGCAYKIIGPAAMDYLKQRECTLGGYITEYTKFYPRVASENSAHSGESFPVILYIATPKNEHWLGENCLKKLATEIVESQGSSGHNVEYLLRLASFMREEVPGAVDDHLFTLESLVRDLLYKRKISLNVVMGPQPRRIRRDSHEEIRRPISFEFTSRVPEKRLRCLHI